MLTNLIPITKEAPTLSQDNIEQLRIRTQTLHPTLDDQGINQYICDLLNVTSLSAITADFVNSQEVEPAITHNQMHELAERIMAYNDNNIDNAIYAVRNILNTVPSKLDDLIDYIPKSRKLAFFKNISTLAVFSEKKDLGDLSSPRVFEKMNAMLENIPRMLIDHLCDEEMSEFQSIPLSEFDGITERQRMLTMTGNYYLSHKVGFACNSMWLACFINHFAYGCMSGWQHQDGSLCNTRHFGFKDNDSVIDIILNSSSYINDVLVSEMDTKKSIHSYSQSKTCNLYFNTMLAALDYLNQKKGIVGEDISEKFDKISDMLRAFDSLLTDGQRVAFSFYTVAYKKETFSYNQLNSLVNYTMSQKKEPEKQFMIFFDMLNFMVVEKEIDDMDGASLSLFLCQYDLKILSDFSGLLLSVLHKYDLDEQNSSLLHGFFEGFLWSAVDQNSDMSPMFDAYLDVLLNIKIDSNIYGLNINVEHIIQRLAELGHSKSMEIMAANTTTKERLYWERRVKIIQTQ